LPDGSAFACTLRSHGRDAAWIRVTGELDLAAAPQLSRALSDAAAFASRIVLDLRELSFMDSSGLHLIVAATRRQREAGGRLVLVRGPHQIDRIFSLTGLTEVVEFIDLDASAPALDCPA
jgi:anti-anti-sigma factor